MCVCVCVAWKLRWFACKINSAKDSSVMSRDSCHMSQRVRVTSLFHSGEQCRDITVLSLVSIETVLYEQQRSPADQVRRRHREEDADQTYNNAGWSGCRLFFLSGPDLSNGSTSHVCNDSGVVTMATVIN